MSKDYNDMTLEELTALSNERKKKKLIEAISKEDYEKRRQELIKKLIKEDMK